MSRGPVRRSQLVAPFGPGSLLVVPNGTSLVAAGLDHWFERDDPRARDKDLDEAEFEIEEWRLQRELGVSHFRLPPDFRRRKSHDPDVPNVGLTIPYLRFPTWSVCPRCRLLCDHSLTTRNRVYCPECKRQNRKAPPMTQVPIVAICEGGHLQDFPWREWAHATIATTCTRSLRLKATGGASLSAQVVECDCGRSRNLSGVTSASRETTVLSSSLERGEAQYLCNGVAPWHGTLEGTGCGLPLRGSQRAATNLYYALVRTSIYLPRETGAAPEAAIQAINSPDVAKSWRMLVTVGSPEAVTAEFLRPLNRDLFAPFSDSELESALAIVLGVSVGDDEADQGPAVDETAFRLPEHELLRSPIENPELAIRSRGVAEYGALIESHFERVMLVDRLRETRALYGLNRILPDASTDVHGRKSMLRKVPLRPMNDWLPCYVVHGEGIFLELNSARLAEWENDPEVLRRVSQLESNYVSAAEERGLRERDIAPRFVLLHTLAHLLMNQLTFDCGYSSAALRERLYVSPGANGMCGVLIYTAAGDAEGTMGGLVRMGKPDYLARTLGAALQDATWCSADPVCMEIGATGQGPDSCNLACCHNCGLVPETACEEFNRFLDRALVIGTLERPGMGYFSAW